MILLEATTYPLPPLWRILTKGGYFLALCAVIGSTLTHALAVRPALTGTAAEAPARRRASIALGISGALLLVLGYLQLAGRLARAKIDPEPFSQAIRPAHIATFLQRPPLKGEWISSGALVTWQNALFATAAIALLVGALRRDDRAALSAGLATVAASLVGSIPTKAIESAEVVTKIAVQGHIVAGCLWLGGLALLAGLTLAGQRPDERDAAAWAGVWARFGTIALWSVGIVVASGLWLTRNEVGSIDQLWTTTFGRVLLAKMAMVGVLMCAGAWNQFVLMPAIARVQRENSHQRLGQLVLAHFPRVVLTESIVGLGILVAIPFLAGSARAEAGDGEVGPIDLPTLGIGLALVATMAMSFWATARASKMLADRQDSTTAALA